MMSQFALSGWCSWALWVADESRSIADSMKWSVSKSATDAGEPTPLSENLPHLVGEGNAMHDSERDRIFGDWLAGHKGILFKVVHAYAFEHADRQDLFQEVVFQIWRSVD